MEDLKEYIILSVKKSLTDDEIKYLETCDDATCRDYIDEKINKLNLKLQFEAINQVIINKYIEYCNKKLENYTPEEIINELSKLKS